MTQLDTTQQVQVQEGRRLDSSESVVEKRIDFYDCEDTSLPPTVFLSVSVRPSEFHHYQHLFEPLIENIDARYRGDAFQSLIKGSYAAYITSQGSKTTVINPQAKLD